MEELNTTQSVEVIDQDRFDTLSVIDMGEAIGLSQVSEEGDLHSVVIGTDQAEKLLKLLMKVLG